MKKPVKPANKKAAAAKKPAAKPAKKPAAKQAAKPAKKPAAKPATKAKAVAAKKPAPKAKAVAAKKASAKVMAKKPAPKAKVAAKKVTLTPAQLKKEKEKLAKIKLAEKLAAKKEAARLAKLKAAEKQAAKKEKEKLARDKEKAKADAKIAAKKAAEAEKAAKKAAKIQAKEDKIREKEKLKEQKRREKLGLPPEDDEDSAPRRRGEDDEEDDDFDMEAPRKTKMVFDEIEEEEIIPVRKRSKSGLDDDIKENLAEEILALAEDFSIDEVFASIRSMELFKVESDECVVRGCDNPATTSGYCRYHYIKLWKDVKKKELILSEGRLAKIIEELVRKYPMKYIETIIHDLADDKAFNHVLKDLDIETDDEEIDAFDDDELLDNDQDIAFETKVTKPSFDD
jgi:hypothetical protein